MTAIRKMHPGDADIVRQIEAISFGAWWQQTTGQTSTLPPRTPGNVLSLLGKDPDGCFVAEVDGQVVGFIFSRTWGAVGWFGTFAVLPEHQGRGIGQRLIAASLDYLRQTDVRVIGLETMPESPNNLGLYLKAGFRARLITLLLTKSLNDAAPEVNLPCWSDVDVRTQERWIGELREANGQIPPGFDYSKEVLSTAQHDQGETLVLTDDGSALGMSTVWLLNPREGGESERAIVQALVLHPAHTNIEAFRSLLTASEALSRSRGKQLLSVPVNTRHTWALQMLLEWGYVVERAMVRMVLHGMSEEPLEDRLVNCSRWAG